MFKRTLVGLTALTVAFCPSANAEPAQSPAQLLPRAFETFNPYALDYLTRDPGNGNGRMGGFHDPVWTIPTPTGPRTYEPTIIPTTPTSPTPPTNVTFNADDEWLIYYYVCGADLEEKHGVATGNFHEIQKVQLPPNVKILIKTGGATTWHHENITGGGLWLYSSDSNQIQQLQSLNEDMGEPDTLISLLEYGEENYNAAHKILIFQDHGSFNGVCFDEAFFQGRENHLSFNELHNSLAAFYNQFPQTSPFELIAFDTCLTGSYECAKSLEGFTRYMMGSETSTFSWDYTPWLSRFTENTAINGGELGRIICQESQRAYGYLRAADTGEYCADVTNFAVIDLSKMPALTKAYDEFFGAAVNRGYSMNGFYTAFDRIAKNTNQMTGTEHYNGLYVDLGRLAQNTQYLLPEAGNLVSSLEDAVWNLPGRRRNGLGISTYYPYNRRLLPEFGTIDAVSENQKLFYNNLIGNVRESVVTPDQTSGGQQAYSDPYNIKALQGTPLTLGQDNHVTATLTPEQLESVSYVRCALMALVSDTNPELKKALGVKDNALVIMGNDADVKVDWQAGTFTDNFRAVWPMLDGHVLFLVTDFSSEDYILYNVPVYHNGDERIMKVSYSYADNSYTIIGLTEDSDVRGIVSGEIYPLEEGDEITPLFMALVGTDSRDAEEGEVMNEVEITFPTGEKLKGLLTLTEGTTFTIGQNPMITDQSVPDAVYAYAIQFFAPGGDDSNNAASQMVGFDVRGGKVVNAELLPIEKDTDVVIKDVREE